MTQPAISKKEAVRRIKAVNKALKAGHPRRGLSDAPSAYFVAAKALGMPRQTMQTSLETIKRTHGLEPDWSQEVHPKGAGKIAPKEAADKQKMADVLEGMRRQIREAHREIAAGQSLRSEIFKLAQQRIEPPSWTFSYDHPGAPGMPILLTSDFQWGETVRASELDGINEYNVKIAQRRYKLLIEKTIDLSFNHMTKPKYPGIIYLRGGDAVSGDIHAELKETNELSSIPAVRSLVEAETAGIEALVKKFGRVDVISVPGNHGRTTIKPQAKRFVEANYDTMSAWMLEREFSRDKRVTFRTPDSGDAMFQVYGWTFLLTHGDRIGSRGGQGFIGPAATIARGMKKLTDYYAATGLTIDFILMGHFHEYMELPWGFCNGSLPGYSEFAKDNRMHPAAPKQLLLFVHPKFGVTARWPIQLDGHPKRQTQVDDLAAGKVRR